MLTDRWMDKEDMVYIYIHNGILLSHKKEWDNAICSNTDRSRDHQTKWGKSERERQIPYAAAADAKSLQSCPTLCNPIDGSPPGSSIPGIL